MRGINGCHHTSFLHATAFRHRPPRRRMPTSGQTFTKACDIGLEGLVSNAPLCACAEQAQSIAACRSTPGWRILALMGTKSRESIYGSSVRHSAERAAEARKEADRLACVAWNQRMLGFKGPAQPSPSLGDALNAGYAYSKSAVSAVIPVRLWHWPSSAGRRQRPSTNWSGIALQGLLASSRLSVQSGAIW